MRRMMDDEQQELGAPQAVRRALEEVQELYDATATGEAPVLRDLLLEEVERSGGNWLVTLSFTRPSGTALGAIMAPTRAFKRVRIDAATGEFKGMEIRTLPSAPPQPGRSL